MPFDRENEEADVATLTWVPVTERHPSTPYRVLVRLRDGRIGAGNWDGKKWHFNAFEPQGEPVAWGALPIPHSR